MNDESMRLTLGVTKALADIQRLRILMMLRSGELCVCQIIEVLGLAPSTVSKHLSILTQAGLVDFRKEGRWAYFRLPDPAHGLSSQPVHDWLVKSLHDASQIQSDWKKLSSVTSCDPVSVSRRQREGGGALRDRALPELREEDGHSGRAGSPSTPRVPLELLESCVVHSLPQRHKLPHDIPGWIQGSARFFITINCKQRASNTLCHEHVAQALFASAKQYEASGRWYLWLVLLMPDHLHLIVSVSPDLGLRSVIGNWKRFQSRHLGIEWQVNFFDHRLRDEEEFRDKAAYIRMNPVRKELTETPEAWPFVLDRTNIGALGDRALPKPREKNAQAGRAGSPSTPRDGGNTEKTLHKKPKKR